MDIGYRLLGQINVVVVRFMSRFESCMQKLDISEQLKLRSYFDKLILFWISVMGLSKDLKIASESGHSLVLNEIDFCPSASIFSRYVYG